MTSNFIKFFNNHKDIGVIFIRVSIGFHLVYGVLDNVVSWGQMLEFRDFLASQNIPLPLVGAIASVYAQLVCGLLFLLGGFTRYAAVVMILNFIVALAVHIGDPYPNAFPALMMLSGSLFLLFNGAGKYALDKEY